MCYDGILPKKHDCDDLCSGSQLTILKQPALVRCPSDRSHYLVPPRPPVLLIDHESSWFYPTLCLHNVLNALNGRVGKHVPKVDLEALREELTPMARVLGIHMAATPCPLEDIYAKYTGLKRARYERAHKNLLRQNGQVFKDQAKVKMFVKAEAYKVDPNKPYPDCRAIQYRSFEYTLKLASKIRPAEHKMYELSDVPGYGEGRLFAKNMNQFQKAEALRDMVMELPGCRIICFDFSRFDAHVQPAMLEHVEAVAWNTAVGDDELKTLLRWQLINHGSHGRGADQIKYRVKGGRMSGDANTAGGNCIISATVLCRFMNHRGHRYRVLVDGDDSVVTYYGPEISQEEIEGFVRRFGMVIGIESKPSRLEEIDFCQAHPVCIDGRWTMIRNPSKVLTKLGMTHHKDSPATYLKRLLTTATCEGFLAKGVPILQEYCRKFIAKCESNMSKRQLKRKYLKVEALSYRMQHLITKIDDYHDVQVSEDSRKSFALAFGIGVQEQLSIESKIRDWEFDVTTHRAGGEMHPAWFLGAPHPEYS